jgi:hypothetical protein
MTETQRKYDAQITLVPEMHLEPTTSSARKQKDEKSLSDIKRKQVFGPQLIFEIIERIKDL